MIMRELDAKKEVISNVLDELSQDEFSLNRDNDNGFDVEQAMCACCCSIILGTGATNCG